MAGIAIRFQVGSLGWRLRSEPLFFISITVTIGIYGSGSPETVLFQLKGGGCIMSFSESLIVGFFIFFVVCFVLFCVFLFLKLFSFIMGKMDRLINKDGISARNEQPPD
jgi:hypothetical protein